MQTDRADAFLDNWTYLKVELNWLERLLLLAVARQRKDSKEVDRVAQTKADRATSHWWKGMVSLDGVAYDVPPEQRKPVRSEPSNYQQQIDARIRASQQQGILLALPNLCDRLKLTPFEKNVVLLGLAPEIHRRYAQLYGYLQQNRDCQDLPTVDLALRLFCRTDAEWRVARSRLLESPLLQLGLVELWAEQPVPLLQRLIKLSDSLVNYLLGGKWGNGWSIDFGSAAWKAGDVRSVSRTREASVSLHSVAQPSAIKSVATFEDLVLPEALLKTLRHLSDQLRFAAQIEETWGFQSSERLGTIALLVGATGTGKTMAVEAIAQSLNLPFSKIDLAHLTLQDQQNFIETTPTDSILLIQSTEYWIGRSTQIPLEQVALWLEQRRKSNSVTFLAMQTSIAIPTRVRSQLDYTLIFPRPDAKARSQLWQRAFPTQTPLDPEINWQELGRKFSLTGGEIVKLARSAAIYAASEGSETVTLTHILQAL
jgi:hypothetical protein